MVGNTGSTVMISDNDVSSPGPIRPDMPGPAMSRGAKDLFGDRLIVQDDEELALLA